MIRVLLEVFFTEIRVFFAPPLIEDSTLLILDLSLLIFVQKGGSTAYTSFFIDRNGSEKKPVSNSGTLTSIAANLSSTPSCALSLIISLHLIRPEKEEEDSLLINALN